MKPHDKKSLKKAAITSFPTPMKPNFSLSNEEKIAIIKEKFEAIMETLGLDLSDESLARTPYRVAKMYVEEIFSGLNLDNFPPISTMEDKYKQEENSHIVFMKVNFSSFCEHHFVPFVGTAFVAYLPQKKLIGLSKIPRLVRYFARRPQVQERLSAQIADSLSSLLETHDVAVSIAAEHYCIVARGIEDEDSHVITNLLRGQFNSNPERKQEFFEAINRSFR